MNALTSSLRMSVNVDLQTVFSTVGSDIVLFVSAMFVWAVLHHVRSKAASTKTPCKELVACSVQESAEEVSIEQERGSIDSSSEEKAVASKSEVKDAKEIPAGQQCVEQQRSLQKYAAEGNIKDAMKTFRSIKQSGAFMSSAMYNAVLQAWIKCGNVWEAESWMDDMKEAQMTDETSFLLIIKALVMARDFQKARTCLEGMRSIGIVPTVAIFDELLSGFAREGSFRDGISLLEEMDADGVQPTSSTAEIVATLTNGMRAHDQSLADVQRLLLKYGCASASTLHVVPAPSLTDVASLSPSAASAACVHTVEAKGSFARIKALRRTLKQHGLLDKAEGNAGPLDGHWETDHGLSVVIEGKMVRWSRQRASRLRFASEDRRSCTLVVYGESTRGRVSQPIAPCATKSLRFDNGDVWHAYDGRVLGETTVFSQSMTKILRDTPQDKAHQARAVAVLKSVSKQGLCLPAGLEEMLIPYIGSELYSLKVQFESDTQRADIFGRMSCIHPRIGFRHCWVRPATNSCGQRTLVNGRETDEASFNRHVRAVTIA